MNQSDENISSRTRVQVTKISYSDMDENVELTATTIYLNKGEILSPASGYLISASQPGFPIRKGDKLFSLESKEHRAMQKDTAVTNNPYSAMGMFYVSAPSDGYVTNSFHSAGDYVQEGTVLCSFVRAGELLFEAYIPFAYHSFVETGIHCKLLLSDSTIVPAVVGNRLNTVDAASQTILILIVPEKKIYLPEGLNARLVISKRHIIKAQVLPEKALLSDETLENFWVMKLIDDSTAVKVTVKPGLHQNNFVQIERPLFNGSDRFLTEGNYGLSDTAKIEIEK